MKLPLLTTKLHPPRSAAALIERTRLLERLDAGLGYKLTMLQAPAGSGKTTLVKQWLAARSGSMYGQGLAAPQQPTIMNVGWVSLDAGDNDLFRFWRYVTTACQALLGEQRQEEGQVALWLLTTTTHPLFEATPIEVALTHLLNGLADPSSGGLLVLDDYHLIQEVGVHETLTFFIDHLPMSVHVLLLSRAEPELPLLRWRARGEVYELHAVDLRFSSEEIANFLGQVLPAPPSSKALRQVERSLEGWAAGLRLLTLTLAGWQNAQMIEQALIGLDKRLDYKKVKAGQEVDALRRYLLDYFVGEILETQPEDIQMFLLRTSVLSRLCAPLCAAVTGSEDGGEQLEEVARAGLFLESMEGPGGWYRYHALFAEAMRREAGRRLGEEELQQCSQRASDWYEREGLLGEAIDAAWLAQDVERVARLLDQFNEQHFYEPYTLLHWLEQMPEEMLGRHPLLCLLFATELHFPVQVRAAQKSIPQSAISTLAEDERARGEELLRMAEEGWRDSGERAWIGAIWAHRALYALLYEDAFSVVVNLAEQALSYMPREERLDRRLQMYRAACLLFVATEELRQGQVDKAQQQLQQALKDIIPPGNRFLAADIYLMLGRSYMLQDKAELAQQTLRRALTIAREVNDEIVIVDALLELAWLAFEGRDVVTAEQYTQQAVEATGHIQPPMQELYDRAELQEALLQHQRGETRAALERLAEIEVRQSEEWRPTKFWLAARLHEWQERLWTAMRRTAGTTDGALIEPLTWQEERVLSLLVAGRSNQEIADEMIISVNTVKYHVKHLYQKLGVSNRLQASEAARHLLTKKQV